MAMKSLSPTRRDVLAGAAALGAASTAGPLAAVAQAAPHRFKVGAAEVTILSDGALQAAWSVVLPDRKKEEIVAAGQASPDIRLQYNVSLVKLGNDVILVDTGAGPDFAPARGKLADNLEKAGIKPDSITKVVFTHAHPDHLWGVVDPFDGSSIFPKARHFMAAAERDNWIKPGIENEVAESARGSALGTQRRLKELGSKIETFKPGAEIVPGLAAVDTSGHTPGHVSFLIGSGSDKMMIGGDALTDSVISFARPEWRWAADWDQDKGVAARKRLLDMLATDKIQLVGYHLPWPGLGRAERAGTAYRFVAAA
jgi:glyoxylase-like metal-dependent hydrolase (beta-lactamase superfamily II)